MQDEEFENPLPINADLISQGIELYKGKLKTDAKLKELELTNSHTYAMEALKKQHEILANEGKEFRTTLVYGVALGLVVVLTLMGFISFMVYYGFKDVIMIILQIITMLGTTLVGGIYYGINRGKKIKEKEFSANQTYFDEEE